MLSKDEKIRLGFLCPYCERRSVFYKDSSVVYSKNCGPIYYCKPCDAYVGCHKGTKKSLGRLANAELRYAKKVAHAYFDPLWKQAMKLGREKWEARNAAYDWLSKQMNLPPEHCHIGMFDIEECNLVVDICKKVYFKA